MLLAVCLFLGGLLLALLDYRTSTTEIGGGLARNSYGEGSRTEAMRAWLEGEKEPVEIEIEVRERLYTSEEIRQLFSRVMRTMDARILGENESLDYIDSDLNLITEIPKQPIEVSWELDRYDVMNVYGKLNEENLDEAGTMVKLQAVLTYQEDEREQALYECTAMIYPPKLSPEEELAEIIRTQTESNSENSSTAPSLILPDSIEGRKIKFYPLMDSRGMVLMVMAFLILFLLYALDRQNQGKELAKKREQMRLDYPEIINKLTLLLGAGMTIKRAWKKICEDYERRKEQLGVRHAYEEMRHTCHEMESAVMESESYENFGRRCGLQEYLRLGALLSQNLRKGTKGLNDLLKLEAVQAFEERKARAKRSGEETATKLLMPMFLMLAVVLIIVIVPAFLSVQL